MTLGAARRRLRGRARVRGWGRERRRRRPGSRSAPRWSPPPAVDDPRPDRLRRRVRGGAAAPACWPARRCRTPLREANAARGPQRGVPRRGRPGAPPPRGTGDAVSGSWRCRPSSTTGRSTSSRRGSAPGRRRSGCSSMRAPPPGPSPYGLVGLLTAAQALREAQREKPLLHGAGQRRRPPLLGPDRLLPPRRRPLRDPREGAADARPPRTRTTCSTSRRSRASEDVHQVVGRIQERAARILSQRARARGEGHDGIRDGAFGGMSEYCGARGHRRLGRGPRCTTSASGSGAG